MSEERREDPETGRMPASEDDGEEPLDPRDWGGDARRDPAEPHGEQARSSGRSQVTSRLRRRRA